MVFPRLKRFGPVVPPPPSPIKRFGPEYPIRKNGMVLLPERYVSPIRKVGEPAEKWVTEEEWVGILEEEQRLLAPSDVEFAAEPTEVLPPVEPIELPAEPAELYPLIARLYPSFPTLKPEELQTQMAELSSWAQEDPEAFLYDLDVRATPEERDIVLRAMGVPEEYFVAEEAVEEQRARLTELITGVYPELTPEEFFDYLETDFASFIDDMQTGGQTAEKLALLSRGLGIPFQSETETDIADIFAQVKMVVPIEDVRQLVTITPEGKAFNEKNQWVGTYNRAAQRFTAVNTNEGWIKDSLIDPWVFAANTVVHSLTQFGSSVLANILFRDLGNIERKIYGDGWVDKVNAGNKVMRDTFRSVNALNQKDFDKWVVKHPELIPKPEYVEGFSEHPELLLDPGYFAYEFASTAPITLGVMSLIAGGVVTGAPALGILAGMALMVPAESADAYQALLDAGAPEDEASNWALLVGTSAGLIEVFSDLLLLKWIAAPIAGLFRKEAVRQMAEATVAHLIKKGVFAYTAVTAIEIIEEELTLAISNAALKVYDENVDIWDGAVRTAAKTFAATTPIALLAGASTMIGISRQQSAQFTDVEKLKKGWQKDPVSEDWFRPKTQEEIVAGLEEARVIEPEVPEVPAVPEVVPHILPLEQVSKLETRAPLDLIRKDESVEIERLTKEIQAEGITEPITIRVREDGSQIVWDGLHRLIVAQDLGIENIPVKYIGEVQMLKPKPPAVEVGVIAEEVIPILEAVMGEQSKTSWHGQRIAADLQQGIWALREGSIDGAIATIDETLARPRVSKKHIQALNRALVILRVKPPAVEVAPVTKTFPQVVLNHITDKINTRTGLAARIATFTDQRYADLVKKSKDELQEIWDKEYPSKAGIARASIDEAYRQKVGEKPAPIVPYEVKPIVFPEVAKPPSLPAVTEEIIGLPPPTEPISQGVAENTQGINEITAKEEVRPSRKVFIKQGLWRDFYKPMTKAEVLINEEKQTYSKERKETNKLIGKEADRRALVWDEVNEKGSVVGLTFDERRAVTRIREWADRWADRKNMPQAKRIKDYIPHLFEEEMIREIREENGIDPVLARILDDRFAGKITDPFLKQRLGKEIGLLKDPIAAMEAYDNVSLKVIYYAPMLNKLNAYMADPNIPDGSRRYLGNYARRMTGELSEADIALNKMMGEFAEAIRKAPVFGEWLHSRLTTGNPAGMAAYNLTGVLYGLWLGFKATSAIRNLGQHALTIAKVGPVYFADAFRLGFTAEGRAYWRDSVNRRSRKRAFMPGYDSSFIAGWVQKFIDISLKMFRGADWVNTHTAFLAGCAEAKSILTKANDALPVDRKVSPERLREYIIDRGDEVFADTQYLYTKMNSMAFAQNAPGRVLSMLTTWTENWIELMVTLIKRTPSQVYLEFEQQTGAKVVGAAWSESYKAILLYMLIVGLGFAIKERTRLKAWEYTGITSVRYLADIMGGDFPALQAPGGVADTIVGFLTGDERRLNEGLYSLRTTFTPSVMRQLDSIAAGDKDWLTFFFYVEGKNIEILRLKEKWEKEWEEYPIFEDAEARRAFILKNKDYAGLSDAKMRSKWREDNPLIEAKMFVVGQFTTLLSDKARTEALRLIEEHKIDTELIDGYEKVFGIDTQETLKPFENRLGNLEKLVIGEEAKYFTMGNYVSEINALVKSVGRHKVQSEATPLTRGILEAQDTFEAYEALEEGDARTLWRQQFPEAEAWMYLLGKVSSFKNPKSAEILLGLMKKYDIPPEAIQAFLDKPERYDELFTPIFELKQATYDLSTEYENYGNTESPLYIEDDTARAEARDAFKEAHPQWVADLRRIEAYENDASEDIVGKWVDRGTTIDEFGAGSSQAKVWLLDNPETHKWALDNKLLTDDGSDWNENVLRINVQMEGLDPESDEYKKLNYRRDAYSKKVPDELIDTYVEYYTVPAKPEDWPENIAYYEEEWFLQEHPELHQALFDVGNFKELKDFTKVPTRDIFKKLWVYNELPTGYERDTYRLENPDLDEWGVSIGMWKTTMSEKRRRLTITEQERFLEDVAEKEREFDEAMRELEELLGRLR